MQKSVFIAGWEDFMTKKFLAITFLPFIITFILFATFFWGAGGQMIHILSQLAQNPNAIHNPDIAQFAQNHPWLVDLVSSWIVKTLLGTLVAILGTLLAILLSTAVATMVMGFFTPYVVKEIHKRHYAHIPLSGGLSILEYLWLLSKTLLKAIGISFLALVLYFIPLLNAIALNIPFYYLFHSLMSLDVGGEIMRAKELEIFLKKYRLKIMSTTAILYLITLIPLAGTLLQVYFVSVMAHLFFRLKAQ